MTSHTAFTEVGLKSATVHFVIPPKTLSDDPSKVPGRHKWWYLLTIVLTVVVRCGHAKKFGVGLPPKKILWAHRPKVDEVGLYWIIIPIVPHVNIRPRDDALLQTVTTLPIDIYRPPCARWAC